MHLLPSALRWLVGIGSLLAAAAAQPAATRWESRSFEATVQGTSTLHDWSVQSTTATGGFTFDGTALRDGWLEIPARSLTGTQDGLNSRMYKALQTERYPVIRFELTEAVPPADSSAPWTVRGQLTVAGGQQPIELRPRLALAEPGRLELEARTELKMTDFGVKPPTFMGMVRTGDAVTITLRWRLQPAAAAP